MATRQIKDAKDLSTNELIYFKGHAQATYMSDGATVEDAVNDKQDILTSGRNIKTINGNSILGEGDITIEGGSNIDPELLEGFISISRDFNDDFNNDFAR